ncbi:DinB family protein [Paenibacillus silviterrae]|uniref:DinB family protein n=1 Tax=Paenibacillus silviterrae TaxID=3242194 RepID=UPI002542C2A6|nr:DinB family protein [Paenibacillus chinjuensis]
MTTHHLIQQLYDFIPWAKRLKETAAGQWRDPIAAGKWSPREILTHIMNWDRNLLEEMLPHVASDAKLSFIDIEQHNQRAAVLAQDYSTLDKLIDDVTHARKQLTDALAVQYDEITHFTVDGQPYTYESFILIFTEHDEHHRNQINTFLGKRRP